MAYRRSSKSTPDVPSEEDWRNMKGMMEKKRAQNRVAQQNYRRNVKRRIEELEQQVATQAKLLAPTREATQSSNQGVSSPRNAAAIMNRTPGTPTQETQKDPSAGLPTPASLLFSPPEDSFASESFLDPLWYFHDPGGSSQHRESFHGDQGVALPDISPNSARGGTQRQPPRPVSPAHSIDLDIGMLDNEHLRSPVEHFSPLGDYRRDYERGCVSCGSIIEKTICTSDDEAFEQTTEGRVGHLIKCARRAGFQDLDSAVTTLYTAKFDEDSECSIAQHFGRRRCLPSLLEELRTDTVSWKTRDVQPYEDEILRSAESLLIAEMRPQRSAAMQKFSSVTSSNNGGGEWSASSYQLQDEVGVRHDGR